MGEDVYRFKLGEMGCAALSDGGGGPIPMSTLADRIPAEQLAQALTEKGYSATEWDLGFNCLLIENGQERVLFDTGFGDLPGGPQGQLASSLQKAGIAPGQIGAVVLTHGDSDHISGVIDAAGGLRYPNARYFMSGEVWRWYTSDETLERIQPEKAAFYRKIFSALQGRAELVEDQREFLPGIRAIPAPGHRSGHTAYEIRSGDARLLHMGDALPHPILGLHPEWESSIDWHPDEAAATRNKLLEWAADQHALAFGAHLPFPGVGRVTPEGKGWSWKPVGAA